MPWLQLRLSAPSELAETISDYLNLFEAQAVTYQDAADQPLFEPAPDTTPLWSKTIILALFSEKTAIEKIITFLEKELNTQFNYQTELLEEQNWERAWLDHFKPMQFGENLWICPSTQTPPAPNAVNIILDPGLAFGTGTHPTTALCLEWLANYDIKNKTIIDYGCGSGILAIAALKLGAKETWAIDYDPQALEATLDNAKRNKIDLTRLRIIAPEELPSIKTDIILANILAKPLIELAPRFAELLNLQGAAILSGVLEQQADDVIRAYESLFKTINVASKEEWVRIELKPC